MVPRGMQRLIRPWQTRVRLLLEYRSWRRLSSPRSCNWPQEHPIRVLVRWSHWKKDIQVMRELFEAQCTELGLQQRPAFGAMIETPAAALNVPAIAKHVISSASAPTTSRNTRSRSGATTDREPLLSGQPHVAAAVLGLSSPMPERLPLTLCGELAGREEMIPQLLAIGFAR